MASKKSVLDMIKAEYKENIQKSNETKTIVIKLNIEDFKVFDAICSKYNKSKQELIVKALENEGLFDKAEVEESTLEQPMN